METVTKISVKVTGDELYALVSANAFDILKTTILEIEELAQPDSIQIYLEKSEMTFKLYFKSQVKSIVGGRIQKIIDAMLVYQPSDVVDIVVTKVLKEKNIMKVVNLNTPISGLQWELGDVQKNKAKVVLWFDLALEYESSDDWK